MACHTTAKNNKKMKRRLAMNFNWPDVFHINDLVKLMVSFLPWLQYRQWVVECIDSEMQTTLCNWNTNVCRADSDIKHNIISKDNMDALKVVLDGFILKDWVFLSKYATPAMLEYALHHGRNIPSPYHLTLQCSQLSNLQVICATHECKPRLQEVLICDALLEQNTVYLNWMLNTMGWRGVIWKSFTCTDELWKTIEPSVVAGRLRCDDINIMPPQMIALQLPQMSVEMRRAAFKQNKTRLEYAAVLWMPEFEFEREWHFPVDVHKYIIWGHYLKGIPGWKCTRDYRAGNIPTDMSKCEEVLLFAHTSKTNADFNAALLRHLSDFWFHHHSQQDRKWIFERCCIYGTSYIAQQIWHASNAEEQKNLLPWLKRAYLCANHDMMEFAFATLSDDRRYAKKWSLHAFDLNNLPVWCFLQSQKLPIFLDVSELQKTDMGNKPVEFIAMLWPMYKRWFLNRAETLLHSALKVGNGPLLRFLTTQDEFRMDDEVLCAHIVELSRMGLADTIDRIKIKNIDYVNRTELYKAYVNAPNVDVTNALFRVFHSAPIDMKLFATCLDEYPPRDFEVHAFLIHHKFITLDRFYHLSAAGKHKALFEPLIARFYADIDF